MKKKTLVQIFLLVLLIFISFAIINFYLKKNITLNDEKKKEVTNSDNKKDTNNQNNLIENIKYTANNTKGDIYEIIADFGETNLENPEMMFLTNVKGNIIFMNKEDVYLTSDFANFNTKTFETTFIDNVNVTRTNEVITGDELYLVLDLEDELIDNNLKKEQNLIRMSNNILFQKPGYQLKADILEIDLITKNIKIYMKDELKKVVVKTELK